MAFLAKNLIHRGQVRRLAFCDKCMPFMEVMRKINATLDPKKVYGQVVDAARGLLGVDAVCLRLIGKDGFLHPVAISGDIDEKRLSRVPVGTSVTGLAAHKKKALSVDAKKFKGYSGKSGYRFISAAPLIFRDENVCIGVLNAYQREGGVLSKEKLDFLILLAGHAANATHNAQMHEELEHKTKVLEQASYTDFLTGLPNRRFFNSSLDKTLANAKRYNHVFSIAIGDLNGFKQINDVLGHSAGDSVLATLGARFEENVRRGDVVTRWGGDEFAFILPNSSPAQAKAFAKKIENFLREFSNGQDGRLVLNGRKISMSIGTATFDPKAQGSQNVFSDDLLEIADKNLREKKRGLKRRRRK